MGFFDRILCQVKIRRSGLIGIGRGELRVGRGRGRHLLVEIRGIGSLGRRRKIVRDNFIRFLILILCLRVLLGDYLRILRLHLELFLLFRLLVD